MSLRALTWAKQQKVGDPIAKLVLLCLADAMNAHHEYAFPSQARLADECECSRQTVNKKLAWLEEKGFVRRERTRDATGRDTGCRYHLLGVNDGDTGVNQSDTGVNEGDRGVSTTFTPGVNDGDTSKGNLNINPKREPLPPVVPHGFDAFWEAYPLHKAKGAAVKAWAKAILRAPPEEIIAAAARYRPAETKFTKHPATWLNQDCWTDEPDHHDEPDAFARAAFAVVTGREYGMDERRTHGVGAAPDADDGGSEGGSRWGGDVAALPRASFAG